MRNRTRASAEENLFGCYPDGLAGLGEIAHRRANACTRFEWYADIAHREFNAAEGLHDHDLVKPTEMADAEDLAIDLVKPSAERQIVMVISPHDNVIGVEALRDNDRCDCVGVPLRPLRACA